MKKMKLALTIILVLLTLPWFSFSQVEGQNQPEGFRIRPGFGFEYFNRKLTWDGGQYTSDLKSSLFFFQVNFEVEGGFTLAAILGYSLSNFDSLVFRKLPLSVELGVGSIGGFLLGAELGRPLLAVKDFEIGGLGQFVYYLGAEKEWDITGLAVEGAVSGKPSWMRAEIGPVIKYKGIDYFYPYLAAGFHKLWGTFKMDQTIQTLAGTEEKKISGKGNFSASLGAIYELADAISLKGEIDLIPYSGSLDVGLVVKAMFLF